MQPADNNETPIEQKHQPVLLAAVLNALPIQANKLYVDGTLGLGGHTQALMLQAIANHASPAQFLGIDQDTNALAMATQRLAPLVEEQSTNLNFTTWHGNYSQVPEALAAINAPLITGGILLDLGVSSYQLDTAERGFSFMADGPLDMRMNPLATQTASDIINTWGETDLADCFYTYGEERFSRGIARKIVERRTTQPFERTHQLAHLVEGIYRYQQKQGRSKKEGKHPATRVFQALRIAVNEELSHLETTLAVLPSVMAVGATVAIITFHSLEDRIVKQWFKRAMNPCVCPPLMPVCQCQLQPTFRAIVRKPIEADETEKQENPRSRSAKLRIYQRI
ncbi:MAG: 16S rRNA (cytosine(1402)-N(4))-methyltransferase RsmH [Candidatus Melainabacteria bacterium]|nr:16S rRNA (cytosine(1402)-N(4))-methyltransferase RsmH [Candidatus Melainabacteria bacterium]